MSKVSKFIAALVGAVASAVSLGLVPDSAAKWVAIAVGFLTAAGVYVVPNKAAPGGIESKLEQLIVAGAPAAIKAFHEAVAAQTTYTTTDPPVKKATAVKKAAKKASDAGAIGLIELGAVCGIIALIGVVCIITGIIPIR